MMTVSDDETAVGALHDDQVDAVLQMLRLLPGKTRLEWTGSAEVRVPGVPSKPQIGHERTGQSEAR